jgi:hypothetical protein
MLLYLMKLLTATQNVKFTSDFFHIQSSMDEVWISEMYLCKCKTAQEGMLESFGIAVWMVFKENIQITKCLCLVLH